MVGDYTYERYQKISTYTYLSYGHDCLGVVCFFERGTVGFGSEPEVYRIFLARLLSDANQTFIVYFFEITILNVRYHRKRPLNVTTEMRIELLGSANSGHWRSNE